MSSIPYSGGTVVNTTFTTTVGTRAEVVSGLGAILVTAGWTSLGSGLYKSGTTAAPKSNSIRVQLTDPGSGNCATVKIQNDAGDRVSQTFFLLPAALKVFRVIACQYNFFCFTDGSTPSREFVCGGTLHIPVFLEGVVTGSLGFMQGTSNSDTDVTIRKSFRTALNCYENSSARQSIIRNGVLLDMSAANSVAATQNLVQAVHSAYLATAGSYRWSDDSIADSEAILCSGISATTDESKRQGLIHNCLLSSDNFTVDTVPSETYDGHTWRAMGGTAGTTARGTLFVATN